MLFQSSYSWAISCAQLWWCLLDGLALQTADRRYQNEGAVRDIIQEHVSWLHLCGVQKNLYPSAPANNLHRMEDYTHCQCVAIFVH